MSSRYIWKDERITSPLQPDGSAGPGKYGRTFYLQASGGNQVKNTPLIPHPFDFLHQDTSILLFKQLRCNPINTNWFATATPECTLTRAWTVKDDYDLYGKLEEAYDQGDFNAGVFGGELGETADMLADRATQLARAAMQAKRGNFAKAAKLLRGKPATGAKKKKPLDRQPEPDPSRVSDGWLELQYGWLPLMGDIFSLADTISKLDEPRKRRLAVRKGIPYKTVANTHFEVGGGGSYSKQIIAYVSEDRESPARALGLMDPELVAWELVPFSFVADWFIPIGGWLQARAFAQRAKGTFVLTTCDRWSARFGAAKTIKCVSEGASGVSIPINLGWQRWVQVTRTVQTSLPAVPLPTFSNGLGKGNRLANAAALVASIFGGRK